MTPLSERSITLSFGDALRCRSALVAELLSLRELRASLISYGELAESAKIYELIGKTKVTAARLELACRI
jgi:hypothetical protein